jgi:hypothetical protein
MTISATTRGLRPGVCTSSNRPAAPFDGMVIYETDTDLVKVWDGSEWDTVGPINPESWQAWTPTLAGWTIGNGTLVARYWKANKTIVFEGSITWGSTTSASGNLSVTLPLESKRIDSYCGVARTIDASVRNYQAWTFINSSTTMQFFWGGTNNGVSGALYEGGLVSNTGPFTWVNTDRLIFQGVYEAL